MDVNQSAIAEFKDIGIIFVKRENIKTSLEERRRANIDPTNGVCFCVIIITRYSFFSNFNSKEMLLIFPFLDPKYDQADGIT